MNAPGGAGRSEWGRGPWETEPDLATWTSGELPAAAARSEMGTWAGYVAVSPSSPFFGLGMNDLRVGGLVVHGGVTYAEDCLPAVFEDLSLAVEWRRRKLWWLGFDCLHAGDFVPAWGVMHPEFLPRMSNPAFATYRDLAYVQKQCDRLATELVLAAEREATSRRGHS